MTRSANDAAVVIAEAIGGDEDDFAKMMTRKARALGMSRTVYRNASGLPDDDQVTTARDQSTLGRAIQDRFPRYYRYFSTTAFNYHGHSIRNHNHLLGSVEGVDGIKTGYTRASGFNLVTSMRRGNRFLVGVVMGGRSGGSRDAIMRSLLAENLDKAATKRTVAAITERNPLRCQYRCRGSRSRASGRRRRFRSRPPFRPLRAAASRVAAGAFGGRVLRRLPRPPRPCHPPQAKVEPAPLTNGVIQTQPIAVIPGSSEPMKPVKVKTVQIKAGQIKLASAGPAQPATPDHQRHTCRAPGRAGDLERGHGQSRVTASSSSSRTDMPPQPPGHGTGNGILGVLPASSVLVFSLAGDGQCRPASAVPAAAKRRHQAGRGPHRMDRSGRRAGKRRRSPAAHRSRPQPGPWPARKADPFTEPVVAKGDRKLFRARFAGLDRDQAEAVCRTLKHSDISCITVRN